MTGAQAIALDVDNKNGNPNDKTQDEGERPYTAPKTESSRSSVMVVAVHALHDHHVAELPTQHQKTERCRQKLDTRTTLSAATADGPINQPGIFGLIVVETA